MNATRPLTGPAIVALVSLLALPTSSCSSEPNTIPWCHGQQVGLGSVNVGAHFVSCPEITSFAVTPLRLSPDQTATLSGTAKDIDSNNLSFSWSAESGTVTDSQAAVTTYRCQGGEGIVKLTFIVSDGQCQDAVEAVIDCIP